MCGILKRAVEDAMAVKEMNGYKLDMGKWHMPNGVCKVCMAGAVMVRTLQVSRTQELDPADFTEGVSSKLFAVNNMRIGNMVGAFRQVYGRFAEMSTTQNAALCEARLAVIGSIAKHSRRGHADWKIYLRVVDILAAVGL